MSRLISLTVLLVAALLTSALLTSTVQASELTDRLQAASVTIRAGTSQGSGVFVTRKVDGKEITFVLTAGHVIDHLKKTRTIIKEGKELKQVDFDDVSLVQEFNQDGRKVGETTLIARVLRYSDAELGEDLAILQVRKIGFTTASVEFYLDEEIPGPGTELYHVGSLHGQAGANSLTSGIVSQVGRVLNLAGGEGVVFDQTTATAVPGSSGGGMFLKSDGRYVGCLVRGAGETFNFMVPSRRLNAWCAKVECEWFVNPKAKHPTADELKKMAPSDQPDVRPGSNGGRSLSADSLKYPVLTEAIPSVAGEPAPLAVPLPEIVP